MKWRRWIVGLLFAVSGCAALPQSQQMLDIEMQAYSLPDGLYWGGVVWMSDQQVVVDYDKGYSGQSPVFNSELWSMKSDGTDGHLLSITPTHQCFRSGAWGPFQVSESRLGYFEVCINDVTGMQLYIMVYDMRTGGIEPLLDYPYTSNGIGSGGFSWNPATSVGIASDGNGVILSEKLAWFTKEKWEYIDLGMPLSFGGKWSPNGTQFAFIGDTKPHSVTAKEEYFSLYIADINNVKASRLIASNVETATAIWSADGNWLIFSGSKDDQDGLWMVNIKSGQMTLVATGHMATPTLSPDGTKLAALRQNTADPSGRKGNELVIINLSKIIAALSE